MKATNWGGYGDKCKNYSLYTSNISRVSYIDQTGEVVMVEVTLYQSNSKRMTISGTPEEMRAFAERLLAASLKED